MATYDTGVEGHLAGQAKTRDFVRLRGITDSNKTTLVHAAVTALAYHGTATDPTADRRMLSTATPPYLRRPRPTAD